MNTDLTSVAMPALASIGGITIAGNMMLSLVAFPSLTTLSGFLIIQDNGALNTIAVPLLATISARSYISFCNNSASWTVPSSVVAAVADDPSKCANSLLSCPATFGTC